MTAVDLTAQVTAWALDEASRQAFGEEFGVSASWGQVPVQTPAGVSMYPLWSLLITARNPEFGQGPLFHLAPLVTPALISLGVRPDEAAVRVAVTEGIGKLRDLAASKLATGNGGPLVAGGRG